MNIRNLYHYWREIKMSCLHNELILESLVDNYEIVKCNNGVGNWELIDTRDGNSLETFDTFKEAELQLEREVRAEFEGLIE